MSEKHCEYLQGCKMFAYFCRVARTVYKDMYCEGEFTNCQRYQRRTRGQAVPDNLLPYGSLLWDDKVSKPPKKFYL